jgi:hypothetical protein
MSTPCRSLRILHVHLVPRYLDDSAPGKPLPWEPKPVTQPEYDRQVQLLTDVAKTIRVPISVPASTTPDSN